MRTPTSTLIVIAALVLSAVTPRPHAQTSTSPPAEEPVWWYGLAGAVNLNFYAGTTQQLTPQYATIAPFHKGFGIGPYVAPVVEYRPDDYWGLSLQLGYDDRRGKFDPVLCPCDSLSDLSARPAYLTLEPSLRWSPFGGGRTGGLHIFAGPRVGLLMSPFHNEQRFAYTVGNRPTVAGDFSAMRRVVYSGQIGAGYDFDISGLLGGDDHGLNRLHLSPFVSYQPHFGQDPRRTDHAVERWAHSTVRVGAVLKFGRRTPLPEAPDVRFSVRAPATVIRTRRIHEVFPLRNYVYFDGNAVEFSGRYARLSLEEARAFREEGLSAQYPAAPTGRSARQLAVYRHIPNIIGDRLRRSPRASITLVGLNPRAVDAPRLGAARAEEIKGYLTRTFGIEGARITVEERLEPPPPLGRTEEELAMLRAESQRVEILTSSPELLLQVGEGERFMLKPVEVDGESPGGDSVVFLITPETSALRRALALPPQVARVARQLGGIVDKRDGRDEAPRARDHAAFSWTLTITDVTNLENGDSGTVRRYGPFTGPRAALPAPPLLGERPDARFAAVMNGQTYVTDGAKSRPYGAALSRTATFSLSQRNKGVHETLRYGILFDIDQARAVSSYDRFLATEVAPRLTDSATVFIRGRTDVIAPTDYNLTLSKGRAEGVLKILEDTARRAGHRGVRFDPSWSGEDPKQAPFGNVFPEERNYNRTVIIDIVPK